MMQKRGQKAQIIFDIFVLFFVLILLLLMNFYLFFMFLVVVDDDVFFYEIISDKWILWPKHRKKSRKIKETFLCSFSLDFFCFYRRKTVTTKMLTHFKTKQKQKENRNHKNPFYHRRRIQRSQNKETLIFPSLLF